MKKKSIIFQKLFCFASFVFLATCCFWYGGRLVYFYLDSEKIQEEVNNNLAYKVINDNELIESGVNSVVLGGKYMLFLWVVQELMQEEFSSNILTKSSFDVIKIWYKLN